MTKHEFAAGILAICCGGLLAAGCGMAVCAMGDLALLVSLVIAVPSAVGIACKLISNMRRNGNGR